MTVSSPEAGPALGRDRRAFRRTRTSFAKALNRDVAERQAHLDSMRALLDNPSNERLHSWMHRNLDVLDTKAQAILGLYSIALAAFTVYFASLGDDAPLYVVGVMVTGILIIAWSIIPLARVSYVYWSSTEEFLNPDLLFLDLLRVRDKRTIIIRRAVLKGAFAVALFALVLGWDLGRRF